MFLNIVIFDPNWRSWKAYSPCIIANFSNFGTLVIFGILGVFGVDFCVEHFCRGCRDVFRMFLNILIFDPNWRFCKGYSPCVIAKFSNYGTLLIFRRWGVFGVDFCVEHFCCGFRDVFRMFFSKHFNFWPKLTFLQNRKILRLCNTCYFSNIGCFWSDFLRRTFLLWL